MSVKEQGDKLVLKFYAYSNSSTLLQLYILYNQPHLEYAVPVWDTHQQGHIMKKFALKVCTGSVIWTMTVF